MSTITTQAQQPLGEPLWFLHNLARILIDGEHGNGRLSLVEMTAAPGDMPPLHVHDREDESFYVLEGELELHLAGRDPIRIGPGEAQFAPRGVAHVYRVSSPGPARWLVACTGTSFARLVRDAAVPAQSMALPADLEFDPAEIAEISARHGIEIIGPPGTLPNGG